MTEARGDIGQIDSEAELAAVAAKLCKAISLTPCERALVDGAPVSPRCVQAVRGLILAGDDPLGEAFLRLRTSIERRKAGAVYTPGSIVARMIAWAAEQGMPARIVDPGAGSGRYLLAAAWRWPHAKLVACEIDPLAALILRANAHVLGFSQRLELFVGDYRELSLPPCEGKTLFIGNPPYVRHHGIEDRWKSWFSDVSRGFGFKASKLAGLHAHFFLRTRQLARRGDFGAFVTSSEWLDVNYGGVIREMLGNGLGGTALQVIAPEAMPFGDTMTTAAISYFKVGSHEARMTMQTVAGLAETGPEQTQFIDWSELRRAPRWSIFVRPGKRRSGELCIGDLFRVHRGQVTGANKVWIEGAYSSRLPESCLQPAVTRGRELFAAEGALSNVSADLRRVIFLPADLDTLRASERAQVDRFLEWAKARGAHETFTARQRSPWWKVPLKAPPPILCSYMARRAPAFVLNDAGARYINIALGLYPREPLPDAVLRAIVAYLRENVCVTEGRTYAGGLVKFEPRELEAVALPSIERLIEMRSKIPRARRPAQRWPRALPDSMALDPFHRQACGEARQQYLDSRDPRQGALDWHEALHEARGMVADALRASDNLHDIAAALSSSGQHMLAFRHLLSPPLSQDQFKLICPAWSKGSEKSGRPASDSAAQAAAEMIDRWRSTRLTPWIDAKRQPAAAELDSLLQSAAILIAHQRLATARRNRIAREQEEAVTALLLRMDWQRLPSRLIDQRAQVPAKHFMHKTRFASGPNENQEVDVACGLGGTVVLAMECKVTNDETNSVKRVNDVLKKAEAWKRHWGNFVQPAAMLQGVMKPDDVQRLLDAGVQVFWTHRLEQFGEWLKGKLA